MQPLQVLTKTVYGNCVGNVISFLFNTFVKILLSTEDIRATDAELSAIALRKVLKRSEMLFVVSFRSVSFYFHDPVTLLSKKFKIHQAMQKNNFL